MLEKYETIPEQYDKEKDISKEMAQLADWNRCWLDSQTDFEEDSGVLKITTPFLDANNDYIQIHAIKNEDGWLLTDNGYATQELGLVGFSPDDQRAQKLLAAISRRFEIDHVNGAFCVKAQTDDFSTHLGNLTHAIIVLHALPDLIQAGL